MQNNIKVMCVIDSYGDMERYVKGHDCEFDQKLLDRCSEELGWPEDVKREDFSVEEKGDGWVMYGYDGIGVLCSETVGSI